MTNINQHANALTLTNSVDCEQADTAAAPRGWIQVGRENSASSVIPFPSEILATERSTLGQPAAAVTANVTPVGLGGLDASLDPAAEQAITRLLQRTQASSSQAACLWFRAGEHGMVEETFGRQVGLELLGLVETRLRQSLRDSDLLYRMSSNEFAIVLDDIDTDAAGCIAERLLERSNGIYQTAGLRLHVASSVGVALYPDDARKPHQLLRYARLALREINSQHATQCQFFSSSMLIRLRDRASMTAELVQALEQDRLVLHYQPQYAIDTQQVVGVEALVRLVSSSGELLGPGHFIELAEQTGLILPLGRWVIEQACRQLGYWRKAGLGHLRMAINVSPHQLRDDNLIEIIDQAVAGNGIRHSDLELEITENQVVEHLPQVEQTLRKLTDRGVRIAIDDFGTGYSSLAYLMELSINTVKVDRAFIERLPGDDRTARIVNAIIVMARELGMSLTAEGIETDAQHQFLLAAGCQVGQGFGFARPRPAEDIERFLS